MGKERLAAFSDGVLAIFITIMVLEFKVPSGVELSALRPLWTEFLSYVLSFLYIGIYWNNHHHMFAVTERVNGRILWANMHLLFWLSLIPITTNWMGVSHFAPAPTAVYGATLLAAAIAYWLLQSAIIKDQGSESLLAAAIGTDIKGKISPIIYLTAMIFAFFYPWVAGGLYTLAALMWLIPDPRIERFMEEMPSG